jgi:sec-independent protein translocase protein TatA
MMGLENPLHIAIVLVVVLMVFGAKRLPDMGKGLGEGMRGFKSALSGESPEEPGRGLQLTAAAEEPPAPAVGDTERRVAS